MTALTNDQIEELVRDTLEAHLSKRNRKAAARWLDILIAYHAACLELGLLDVPLEPPPVPEDELLVNEKVAAAS